MVITSVHVENRSAEEKPVSVKLNNWVEQRYLLDMMSNTQASGF